MLPLAFAGLVAPVRMCARGVGGGRGSVPRSRLGEFAHAGGDRGVQDALVRELRWRAAQAGVDEDIDEKIRGFDAGTADLVSDLYFRSERDIIERNEQMASREAAADVARWNTTYWEGRKTGQKQRDEISAELAIVNKLLLTQSRKKRKKKKRRAARAAMRTRTADEEPLLGRMAPASAAATIGLFTVGWIQGFESYARTHSPEGLTKVGIASLAVMLAVGHSSALRRAVEESRREHGP